MAFACAFTMFAGAAFTDEADISDVNADAVELLTTLNIIQGDPDGSFAPEREVTRAEMAKMIYTIRNNGNDDASAYETVTTSFTDISGHWAEGYIKYLQNTGIVAGKSAYIFDPDSTVTTAEAMKMALVLAGYRADKAELTGTKWLNNTVSLATTVGMTKDVQSTIAGGCTRQDAAQILSNTLTDVWAVQWSEITGSFLNDSKQGLAFNGNPITVGNKWMDLIVYVGRMTASGELQLTNDDAGKDCFVVDVDTRNDVSWERVLSFKDGKDHTDLVGQEVKVLCGEKIDEVYGVYATGTSKVVETTMDQVSVQSDWKVKVDGTTYNTKDTRNAFVDLEGAQAFAAVFSANGRVAADGVKLIDWDNDGKFETVLVNTVTAAKVNSVTDASVTVGSIGTREPAVFGTTRTIDFDGNNVAEGIAKGDYIAITQNLYDDTWNVAKIEKVEGTVNGLVQNQRKIRVDGEWYTLANNKTGAQADGSDLYVVPGGRDTFTNGDKIAMYAIGSVVYFADSSTGNDANRSVLMAYASNVRGGDWNDSKQAKVILADGTKKTVNVITIDGEPTTEDPVNAGKIKDLVVGKMYRYTINNDGDYSLFTLSNASSTDRAGYDSYVPNAGGKVAGSKIDKYMIADDAVVFALIGGDDAAVYTGKTIKNANQATWGTIPNGGVLVEDTNGIDYARMFNIVLGDELNEANNYAVLLSDAVRSKDDAQYIEYHLWNGSEVIDVKEKTDERREGYLLDGDVIAYENNGEGMIKSVDEVTGATGTGTEAAIRGYQNGDIRLLHADGRDEAFEVNGDTTVIYFNTNNADDARGVTGDGYDYTATPVEGVDGAYYGNAVYVLDNDGSTIEFILIDINGNLYGNKMNDVKSVSATGLTAATLQSYLNTFAKVTVIGNLALDGDIIVPNYKTLDVRGNLDLNEKNMEVKPYGTANVSGEFYIHSSFTGTITVGSLKIDNTGVVTPGSKIIIAKAGQDLSSTTIDLTNVAVGVEIVDADNTVYTVATNEETGSKELTTETGETPDEPGTDEPGGDTGTTVPGELPAAEVDSGSATTINVPWHGAATSNAEVLAKIQADLPDLNITAVKLSSAGHTATAADGTEYTVVIKAVYLITVTDANGGSYSAYSDWKNGNKVTMANVPDGSYIVESADDLSPSSGSINVNTTDKYNTKPFTLTAAKDAAYVQAVKIVSDSNTTVKIGDHEVDGNDYVKVGSALTLTGAKGTDSFTQITLNGDVVETSDYDKDASYKCTASLDLVKDDAITFATKQGLHKVSVDGKLLDGVFNLTSDAINLDESYVGKKLMPIKTASGSASLHLFDDGAALLTPATATVDVAGGVAQVAQIEKNKVTSAKAEDGVVKLVTVSEITGDTTANIAKVDVLYNDGVNDGVVENVTSLSDWSSKKLYVPTGASVQVTSADTGLTVGHILKAVVGDEVLATATVAAEDKAISIEFTAENGITVSLKAAS